MKDNINYKELVTDALETWNTAINNSENSIGVIKLYFEIKEDCFHVTSKSMHDPGEDLYKIIIQIKNVIVFLQNRSIAHEANNLTDTFIFNQMYYRIYRDILLSGVNNLYTITMQLQQQREERLKPIKDE